MYEMEGPHSIPAAPPDWLPGEPALPDRPPASNAYLKYRSPSSFGFRSCPRIRYPSLAME